MLTTVQAGCRGLYHKCELANCTRGKDCNLRVVGKREDITSYGVASDDALEIRAHLHGQHRHLHV